MIYRSISIHLSISIVIEIHIEPAANDTLTSSIAWWQLLVPLSRYSPELRTKLQHHLNAPKWLLHFHLSGRLPLEKSIEFDVARFWEQLELPPPRPSSSSSSALSPRSNHTEPQRCEPTNMLIPPRKPIFDPNLTHVEDKTRPTAVAVVSALAATKMPLFSPTRQTPTVEQAREAARKTLQQQPPSLQEPPHAPRSKSIINTLSTHEDQHDRPLSPVGCIYSRYQEMKRKQINIALMHATRDIEISNCVSISLCLSLFEWTYNRPCQSFSCTLLHINIYIL
jgi:hypothetical protein